MKHWVKVWTKRVLSLEFNSLSLEAQVVWLKAYMLAAACDADGLLMRSGQPISYEEFWTPRLNRRKTQLAVEELVFKGYLQKRGDGTLEVVNFLQDQRTKDALRKERKFRGNSAEIPPEIPLEIPRTEVIEPPTLVDKSTRSGGTAAAENGAAPWVLALKDRVKPLLDAPMPGLGLDGWLVVGRYAAYRFANCTLKEPANVKMGRKFAGQLAEMSQRKRFASVTVREFLGAAKRVWEASGNYPLYGLWAVSAAFENEQR